MIEPCVQILFVKATTQSHLFYGWLSEQNQISELNDNVIVDNETITL